MLLMVLLVLLLLVLSLLLLLCLVYMLQCCCLSSRLCVQTSRHCGFAAMLGAALLSAWKQPKRRSCICNRHNMITAASTALMCSLICCCQPISCCLCSNSSHATFLLWTALSLSGWQLCSNALDVFTSGGLAICVTQLLSSWGPMLAPG